jgi:adenylosuccinate lyase
MAYKKNPMRSERIASLARYVIIDAQNPAFTAGSQWFERTLDDSANSRITIPGAFLAIDSILSLYMNIIDGLTVYPKMIKRHLDEELPFMITEDILMLCVKRGGDRQVVHERIRQHSLEAAKRVKQDGANNDLISRILSDEAFGLTEGELDLLSDASQFTGRAEEQTEEFLSEVMDVLNANRELLGVDISIMV